VSFTSNHRWHGQAASLAWEKYTDGLLRVIAAKTIRSRQKQTTAELRKRLSHWIDNTPQVDRRLKEISPTGHTLLAVIRLGKRNHWHVATLLELASSLHSDAPAPTDGLKIIEELFVHGLLLPDVSTFEQKLSSFEDWLGCGIVGHFQAWVAPEVLSRIPLSFETLPPFEGMSMEVASTPKEADGLEWFLRLAVLWQQVHELPARMTRQGGFFKRDQERLANDVLLNQPATEFLAPIPDMGHFLVDLGLQLGLFAREDTQLEARQFPESWQLGWQAALNDILGAGVELTSWSVNQGWREVPGSTSPFSSGLLLLIAVLMREKSDRWFSVRDLCGWLTHHHCYWSALENPPDIVPFIQSLLLGWLYPLRIIQAGLIQEPDGESGAEKGLEDSVAIPAWAIRLSPFGRLLLSDQPTQQIVDDRSKMLLIQPNMEMVAYRQGLTPRIVADLSQIASWTGLGSACTLHLDQASVQRALESTAGFESISGMLQRHSVHAIPSNVLEAIRTWAAKRDRITVYERVNLLEFLHQTDRDTALSRGLAGIPIGDRYLLIENEHGLDFRHFRSLGTRDYALPPMTCVAVAPDGVSLAVDASKADLLVDSELKRFSMSQDARPTGQINDVRQAGAGVYAITPQSLSNARLQGMSLRFLEEWFRQRTGQTIPAAVRLLWNERNGELAQLSRPVLLTLPEESIADGLWQWPETRDLLQERIGPVSFLVAPEHLGKLQKKLEEIGYPYHSHLEFESKLP
jgi:hypothetical protein